MRRCVISGISPRFRGLSQSLGQVTHVLLTRSPLEYPRKGLSARLACVKHAASVRPEPGSNSPTKTIGKSNPNKSLNKGNCQRKNYSWHWHIKHPVEFSKNNHTPKRHTVLGVPFAGHLFNFTWAISHRQIRLSESAKLFAQAPQTLAPGNPGQFFGVWQDGRCGYLRCLARFPAGS